MKIDKRILAKYNQPDTIAVISLYPNRGEVYSPGMSGVASYTKNVVKEIGQKVVVFADKVGSRNHIYQEKDSLIIRSWRSNHPRMWIDMLEDLRQFTRVKSLLIHFDFSMYGDMLTAGLILPFLLVARLMGYAPAVVSHHVIKDVRHLSGQVGLGIGIKAQLKAFLYNLIFRSFYLVLGYIASKVIVLESPLLKRLKGIIPDRKLAAIPHAIDTKLKVPQKNGARKRLGYGKDETIVMFFGYINWFKGADFFANSVKDMSRLNGNKVRFVMAGGESPTMKNKKYYQDFFHKVTDAVNTSTSLQMTGYVPQAKIADYFAASDLVVFPYREFMCASGVLSLVLSYKKPFIVSDKLLPMLHAEDISQAMKRVGLRAMDITFLLKKDSMVEVMERVLENGLKKKLYRLASSIRVNRSFASTAYLYSATLKPKPDMKPVKYAKGAWAYAKNIV